jgi:3-deoxy-manno-octulosonate cytidylyltransferase (CMP-KDO synthetase)
MPKAQQRNITYEKPMKITAIIPARYGSTRFEGKPLADILGKPMVQHVYERVLQAKRVTEVVVATDDRRIFEAVRKFGGQVVMTARNHCSGTDRVAEVARKLRSEIIVNVQGDEPLIQGDIIDMAIRPLVADKTLLMSTLMTKVRDVKDWLNPNVVKVVVDKQGRAIYFSRAPIPYPREMDLRELLTLPLQEKEILPEGIYKHIGVYIYRREFLLKLSRMKPTPLEKLEKLEQLRALENGFQIKAVAVNYEPISVDTPEDRQKVIALLSASRQNSSRF